MISIDWEIFVTACIVFGCCIIGAMILAIVCAVIMALVEVVRELRK